MENNWWQSNLNTIEDFNKFSKSLGDVNAPSRQVLRRFLSTISPKPETILECGCGLAIDHGWISDLDIKYSAIDFTPKLVELGKSSGIDIKQSNIEQIDYPDHNFDIVYCRHVLEHLSYYEAALTEMLRVAKNMVIVIFFINPSHDPDIIDYNNETKLYHNRYNIIKLQNFLKDYKLNYGLIQHSNESILFIQK
jgi:ubiquinone/menaquinone biosynthesis C-methylase UbiE